MVPQHAKFVAWNDCIKRAREYNRSKLQTHYGTTGLRYSINGTLKPLCTAYVDELDRTKFLVWDVAHSPTPASQRTLIGSSTISSSRPANEAERLYRKAFAAACLKVSASRSRTIKWRNHLTQSSPNYESYSLTIVMPRIPCSKARPKRSRSNKQMTLITISGKTAPCGCICYNEVSLVSKTNAPPFDLLSRHWITTQLHPGVGIDTGQWPTRQSRVS